MCELEKGGHVETLELCQGTKNPGTKWNSKVVIFDNHLASKYYKCVKQYDYMWLSGNRSDQMSDGRISYPHGSVSCQRWRAVRKLQQQ